MVDSKQVCCGDDSQLHDNKLYAEGQLAFLLQRFNKTLNLKATYEAGIESDIKKGYIRKDPPEEHHGTNWVLCHCGLVNFKKPGKVRKISKTQQNRTVFA